MSDDELRKVAERLRLWGLIESTGNVSLGADTFTSRYAVGDAALTVASRLLDLLPPADDGEPVDADWLRAVGFVEWGGRGSMILFHRTWQPDHDDSIEVNATHQWAEIEHGFDVVRVPNISTRGHVRRLCAALGITLTESDRDRQGA